MEELKQIIARAKAFAQQVKQNAQHIKGLKRGDFNSLMGVRRSFRPDHIHSVTLYVNGNADYYNLEIVLNQGVESVRAKCEMKISTMGGVDRWLTMDIADLLVFAEHEEEIRNAWVEACKQDGYSLYEAHLINLIDARGKHQRAIETLTKEIEEATRAIEECKGQQPNNTTN